MGTFMYPIEVGNPQGQRFERVEALVDTGATFTVLPGSLLRGLGIPAQRRIRFRLADGSVLEREAGETLVRLDGQVITTTVVFAEEGAPSLLGVVTLETALLAVDPVRQQLIPTEALVMAGLGAGSPAVAPISASTNSPSS